MTGYQLIIAFYKYFYQFDNEIFKLFIQYLWKIRAPTYFILWTLAVKSIMHYILIYLKTNDI